MATCKWTLQTHNMDLSMSVETLQKGVTPFPRDYTFNNCLKHHKT